MNSNFSFYQGVVKKLFIFIYTISDKKYLFKVGKFLRNLLNDRYYLSQYRGFKIYSCPMHSIGGELIRNRIYEKEIGSLITFHTKNSYSFIDIGANIGIHSLLASSRKINEEQKILSIEPYEPIYEVLKKNIDANGFTNIIPINKGLVSPNQRNIFFFF